MLARVLLSILVGLIAIAGVLPADPGDVHLVQTFSFDSISTRRAIFPFPDDRRTWAKIIMRYTLRCDSLTTGDQYDCGEWDVTTHTFVRRGTGRMDSTRIETPSFVVDGELPDELRYSTEPRYHIATYWDDPAPAAADDGYLYFEGTDHVEIPAAAMATVDSALTVAFWVRGDDTQPIADHLFEGCLRTGRVVNLHLPWNTGTVYWDAGGYLSGANNRLAKAAGAGDYKGRWNHWTFTKDLADSSLTAYLNGQRWHHVDRNMFKEIGEIDRLILGANCNASGGWFAGAVDEFQIWDVALTDAEITALPHHPPTPGHPKYRHLRLYYPFDASGEIRDHSPYDHHGVSFGQPQWRPFGFLGRRDEKPGPQAVLRRDSVLAPTRTVIRYDDPENPEFVTSRMEVWPDHDVLFDGGGVRLEEIAADSAEVLEQEWRVSYSEPFEVVERFEIARYITPYGKRLDLGEDGFSWHVDVTDYAPLLRGEVDLEAHNQFELIDLDFLFIEGTPPREVLDVRNVWPGGGTSYRKLADDDVLPAVRVVLDPTASGYRLRSRISGHGHAGPEHCCEWVPKEHTMLLNGLPRFPFTTWRNCGANPVYPQGGTWQFDRAGWCPATFVDTYDHEITPLVSPGDEVAIDYDIEDYDPDNGEAAGTYVYEHQLFTYGPPSFERDAAVDEIIAPTDHDEWQRRNPIVTGPVVRIRNQGADVLRTLEIRYGLDGGKRSTLEWKGELAFMEPIEVQLPAPDWAGLDSRSEFVVRIAMPNGEHDQNGINDVASRRILVPTVLPERFIVRVASPGFGRAADNAYAITDAYGTLVTSRESFTDDTVHEDTVHLAPGAYVFTFTDREEDGMIRHWWLRSSAPEQIGENGQLSFVSMDGEELVDFGYDFAEGVTLEFFVGNLP